MAKAKLNDLRSGTHRGRPAKRGGSRYSPTEAAGVRGSGLRSKGNVAASMLTRISSTPHGPEPHWPAGG